MDDGRRALPAIGALLERPAVRALGDGVPRSLLADAVRAAVTAVREGHESAPRSDAEWEARVAAALRQLQRPSLRAVINATGVVLHTNLGRAPLAQVALDAIARTAASASNLEYDLDAGRRGSRYVHCVSLLCELTGAEDAIVVNNCAAALVLALNTFARDREAIVSRGELVEIGGASASPTSWREAARSCARSGRPIARTPTTTAPRSPTRPGRW